MSTDEPARTAALTEEIWREVVGQLRAFVARRIADPHRAEDLVGDILLRIHQNLGSVDDRERLSHWVSRVARNAVIDEYRRAGRERERVGLAPVETVGEEPPLGNSDPLGAPAELAGCLRPLLEALPAEQRRAVELVDLDGWPQARAAREEGVSLSGMKSRVQRGRRRLVDLLGQCCTLTLDSRGMPMAYVPPRGCDCGGTGEG